MQKVITDVLGRDAEVISKGPQKDLDDTTTKEEIVVALQKATGCECLIRLEAIKSLRKAYGGRQTASLTLVAVVTQKILGLQGKIRIVVNCRIRRVIK